MVRSRILDPEGEPDRLEFTDLTDVTTMIGIAIMLANASWHEIVCNMLDAVLNQDIQRDYLKPVEKFEIKDRTIGHISKRVVSK